MMKLTEACEYGLSAAQKMGADQSEAYASKRDVSIISREARRAETRSNLLEGVAFRVVKKKAVGFTYTSKLTKREIRLTVQKALKIAEHRGEDPYFKSLPKPEAGAKKGVFDKKLADLEFDEFTEIFDSIEASSKIHKALKPAFTFVGKITSRDVLMNSLGIEVEDEAAYFLAMLGILTTKGLTPNFHSDVLTTRKYDFNPSDFGKQVGTEALSSSGPKTLNYNGRCNVIFHPNAFFSIPRGLIGLVTRQVKADSLAEKKSLFTGKIDEQVASPLITLTDDGTLEDGFFTSSHDDEGVPKQKTVLIENGRLKSFLYDSYYAGRFGEKSTGNSSRLAMIADLVSYRSPPFIGDTNIVVDEGRASLENLVRETKEGFYVKAVMGAHTADMLTGEFSLPFSGYKIEHGELKHPVMMTMVSGNIVNLLKDVDGVTKERKTTLNTTLPWLKTTAKINSTRFSLKTRFGLFMMKILSTLGVKGYT